MADDRMREQDQQRNAGTKTEHGNLGQNAPSRNPNEDRSAGQRDNQGNQGKDTGLGKGPGQGNTGRDELNFEKGGSQQGGRQNT